MESRPNDFEINQGDKKFIIDTNAAVNSSQMFKNFQPTKDPNTFVSSPIKGKTYSTTTYTAAEAQTIVRKPAELPEGQTDIQKILRGSFLSDNEVNNIKIIGNPKVIKQEPVKEEPGFGQEITDAQIINNNKAAFNTPIMNTALTTDGVSTNIGLPNNFSSTQFNNVQTEQNTASQFIQNAPDLTSQMFNTQQSQQTQQIQQQSYQTKTFNASPIKGKTYSTTTHTVAEAQTIVRKPAELPEGQTDIQKILRGSFLSDNELNNIKIIGNPKVIKQEPVKELPGFGGQEIINTQMVSANQTPIPTLKTTTSNFENNDYLNQQSIEQQQTQIQNFSITSDLNNLQNKQIDFSTTNQLQSFQQTDFTTTNQQQSLPQPDFTTSNQQQSTQQTDFTTTTQQSLPQPDFTTTNLQQTFQQTDFTTTTQQSLKQPDFTTSNQQQSIPQTDFSTANQLSFQQTDFTTTTQQSLPQPTLTTSNLQQTFQQTDFTTTTQQSLPQPDFTTTNIKQTMPQVDFTAANQIQSFEKTDVTTTNIQQSMPMPDFTAISQKQSFQQTDFTTKNQQQSLPQTDFSNTNQLSFQQNDFTTTTQQSLPQPTLTTTNQQQTFQQTDFTTTTQQSLPQPDFTTSNQQQSFQQTDFTTTTQQSLPQPDFTTANQQQSFQQTDFTTTTQQSLPQPDFTTTNQPLTTNYSLQEKSSIGNLVSSQFNLEQNNLPQSNIGQNDLNNERLSIQSHDDRINKLENYTNLLKENQQNMKLAINNLQGEVNNYKDTQNEVETLKAQNELYKQQLSELNNLRSQAAEANSLKMQLAQLTPLKNQSQEIAVIKNQLTELDTLRQKVAELNSVQAQQEELDNLRQQVGQMNELKQQLNELDILKNKTADNEILQKKVEELEMSKSKYEQEIKELRNTLSDIDSKQEQMIVTGDIIHNVDELEMIIRKINKLNKKITLNLLYKASADSDRASAFHEKCDNAKSSLVLVETDKGKRFGGFTTKSWEGDCIDKKDEESFVFSLDKMKTYDNIYGEDAIGCYPKFGPIFLGCQIRIYDNAFSKGGTTFEKGLNFNTEEDFELTGGERVFGVKDIEVYEVIPQ